MYHGPLRKIKEENTMTTTFGNNDRLTARINRSPNPRAALAALCVILSACQGRPDTITPETVKAILGGQEKGGEEA